MNMLFIVNTILTSSNITDKQNSSWPNLIQVIGQLFSLIFILGIVIFLIFMLARMMTKLRVGMGGDNIKVLEYKNIGFQNNLLIVQISSKYFLLSSSKERVNFIAELGEDDINKLSDDKNSFDFKEMLNFYSKKNKDEVD